MNADVRQSRNVPITTTSIAGMPTLELRIIQTGDGYVSK